MPQYIKIHPKLYLVLYLVAIVMALAGTWEIWKGGRTYSWPTAAAEVLESKILENTVVTGGKYTVRYNPIVKYHYDVNGVPYTNDAIYIADSFSKTKTNASLLVANYPKGAEIEIYYNPQDPEESILERGIPPKSFNLIIVGIVSLGLGVAAKKYGSNLKK